MSFSQKLIELRSFVVVFRVNLTPQCDLVVLFSSVKYWWNFMQSSKHFLLHFVPFVFVYEWKGNFLLFPFIDRNKIDLKVFVAHYVFQIVIVFGEETKTSWMEGSIINRFRNILIFFYQKVATEHFFLNLSSENLKYPLNRIFVLWIVSIFHQWIHLNLCIIQNDRNVV